MSQTFGSIALAAGSRARFVVHGGSRGYIFGSRFDQLGNKTGSRIEILGSCGVPGAIFFGSRFDQLGNITGSRIEILGSR